MVEVFNMDMGIIPMVKDMMATGIEPIPEELRRLGEHFAMKMRNFEFQIENITGHKINVGSPLQVADLLFNKLRLSVSQKHKGKISTDDKTLARMVSSHPVVPMIREWRSYSKLKSTYTSKLHKFIAEDGRIHSKISVTRTATGRLASSKPNIMNQPTRSEDGKAIRKAFTAREGCVFVSNDLSQIEMRVLAHESGDERLIHIFQNDLDIHAMTASGIFKLPIAELDEMKHRYPAKRVGFGVVYGVTAAGLQEQLLMMNLDSDYWTIVKCQALIDEWFALYPGVDRFMQDLVSFALRHGYVSDMFGRRRYLGTIRSTSRRARAEAARQAGNMPIQCLPGFTKVLTSKGFKRIDQFTRELVWTGNEWAMAKRVNKGVGQLVEVAFDDGLKFTCDTTHQVLISNNAWPVWTYVGALKKGDVLAHSLTKAPNGEQIESKEFWYWVGRYYGDGYMIHLHKGEIRPTTGTPISEYRSYIDWAFGGTKKKDVKRLMSFLKENGYNPHREIQRKGKSIVFRVRDHGFNKRMIELGISANQVAWTKRIGDVVFTLSADRRAAFIQGYYDADGTTRKWYPKGWSATAITSVNRELLQDTALILRSLGRRGYIHGPYRQRDPKHRQFYRLHISEDVAVPRRVASVRKLRRREQVYTLTVQNKTHSFDSEGVVSKNSGAAGVFKAGMKNLTPVYKNFQAQGYHCDPVLPIHDDLVFEVSEDLVDTWVPLQQDIMEHSVTLKVPIKSDAKVGKIWGEMTKYPTKET
jgi:intein/homing endonuclease